MMIYKTSMYIILSCDPRACLATGAMGKPQTLKRVPIMKHENQPPLLFLLPLPFPFSSLTPPSVSPSLPSPTLCPRPSSTPTPRPLSRSSSTRPARSTSTFPRLASAPPRRPPRSFKQPFGFPLSFLPPGSGVVQLLARVLLSSPLSRRVLTKVQI